MNLPGITVAAGIAPIFVHVVFLYLQRPFDPKNDIVRVPLTPETSDNLLFTAKIVILGNSAVGKSTILETYLTGQFHRNLTATLGFYMADSSVIYRSQSTGHRFRLKIWDTAGQETYKALTPQALRGASGCLLVYDVTDRKSFDSVDEWRKLLKSTADYREVAVVVLANKADLIQQRRVTVEEGRKRFDMVGPHLETTSANPQSIQRAFLAIAALVYTQEIEERKTAKPEAKREVVRVQLRSQQSKQESSCSC